MSLSRFSQKKTPAKKRILPAGFAAQFFKGALAFFTASGVILCSLDAPLFVGVTMSLTSPVFLVFVAASLFIGLRLASKAIYEDKIDRKKIEFLKTKQDGLYKQRNKKIISLINELTNLETALVEWQKQAQVKNIHFQNDIRNLRIQIGKLSNETYQSFEEADQQVKKLSGHIKLLQLRFRQQFKDDIALPSSKPIVNNNNPATNSGIYPYYRNLKKFGNRAMAFLGGASTIVGLAGTAVGVMGPSALLVPPLFWILLAGVGLGAILLGALTCYIEFKLERNQESKINALEASNQLVENANPKIGGLVKQVSVMVDWVKESTEKFKIQRQIPTDLWARNVRPRPRPALRVEQPENKQEVPAGNPAALEVQAPQPDAPRAAVQ
jgi:hypothetical protein